MINCLCEARLLKEAKKFLILMEADSCIPQDLTCNTIIYRYLKGGRYVEARMHLEKMVAKGLLPDSSTLSMLLDLDSIGGNNPNLLNMVQELLRSPINKYSELNMAGRRLILLYARWMPMTTSALLNRRRN